MNGNVINISNVSDIVRILGSISNALPIAAKFIVPPVYIATISDERLLRFSISEFLNKKNDTITAITIAIKPDIRALKVFGNDLVHNLKLQLNSIKGIANGTVMFINNSCILAISDDSLGMGNRPLKDITIPTK
jgi:hypothetical protein